LKYDLAYLAHSNILKQVMQLVILGTQKSRRNSLKSLCSLEAKVLNIFLMYCYRWSFFIFINH